MISARSDPLTHLDRDDRFLWVVGAVDLALLDWIKRLSTRPTCGCPGASRMPRAGESAPTPRPGGVSDPMPISLAAARLRHRSGCRDRRLRTKANEAIISRQKSDQCNSLPGYE